LLRSGAPHRQTVADAEKPTAVAEIGVCLSVGPLGTLFKPKTNIARKPNLAEALSKLWETT